MNHVNVLHIQKNMFPKIENILKEKILTVYQNLTKPFKGKNCSRYLKYCILAENPWKDIRRKRA